MRGPWRYFDLSSRTCERFTDRARLVLALADEFAIEQRSLEISPEHILRGLACGGQGVGRAALEDLGVDLIQLLPKLLALLPPHAARPLPSMDELRASDPTKIFPLRELGPGAEACLVAARKAAAEMGHNYVGTEHLLLGLLGHPSPAADFLKKHGATNESARGAVTRLLYGN